MRQSTRSNINRLRPAVLCWLLMMLGDSIGAYCIEQAVRGSGGVLRDTAATAFFGFYFGQFALAAMVGGLLGRSWLSGWLLAVGLTAVATLMVILGVLPVGIRDLTERTAIIALAPTLTLAACAPLMLMRGLRGWTLTLGKEIAVVKQRASVEDLMLLSVAVACSLSLLRVVRIFSPGFSETKHGMVIAAFFFTWSLLLMVPVTAVTFRARNWRQRLWSWMGITVVAYVAFMLMNTLLLSNTLRNIRWETLGNGALGASSCALTIALGATALLASGFRLTRFANVASPTLEETEECEMLRGRRSLRRQTLGLMGGVVLATLLVNVWLGYRDHRQVEYLERLQRLSSSQGAHGTSFTITGDDIVSVTAGKGTTDDNFYRFKNFRKLTRLSLADCRITDRTLAEIAGFPELQTLDLSGTDITDSGLDYLGQRLRLFGLSVARTHVSFEKVLAIAGNMQVNALDISGLALGDDQLQQLSPLGFVSSLALRGNPITDAGLAKLLASRPILTQLDVSDTAIDGSGLLAGNCPMFLILDGTKITDANLIALMRAHPRICISLKNTGITAQVLQPALAAQACLSFGSGQISDEDLTSLSGARLPMLGLNGPEFTGACLPSLTQVQRLDLSNSGVTDQAFERLTNLDRVGWSSLNLAHTDLTDAVLPILEQWFLFELDLRDTKITAAGLLRQDYQGRRIFIDHDQFTPAQLAALRERLNVIIHDGPNSTSFGFNGAP